MESPVIVENLTNFAAPVTETGFPFDDIDEYESDGHLRSRLQDIAQRHPQFASSLNRFDDFPSGSFRRKRNTSSGSQSDREFGSGPSSARDVRFGSPFSNFPFDDFEVTEEKPPEAPKNTRGRKPTNPNLPQHLSNTVDLGQKQAPVEENRSQRSMSAPPENRSQRSEGDRQQQPQAQRMGGNASTDSKASSSQQAQAPKVRVIPIHVEGRDEPIIPKDVDIEPEKIFGNEHVNTSTGDHPTRFSHQNAGNFHPSYPESWRRQTPPRNVPPTHHEVPQERRQPQQQQQQQHNKQQTPPPQTPQPPPPPPPPQPQTGLNDPLEKIKSVKNDVLDLMKQVEMFTGTRKDKTFMYLDEMLTRNLLKLDDIETEGKETIRQARKEAIKCIQDSIAKLEAKGKSAEKKEAMMSTDPIEAAEPEQARTEVGEERPKEDVEQQQSTETPKLFKSETTLMIGTPPAETDPAEGAAPTETQPMEVEQITAPAEVDQQNENKC